MFEFALVCYTKNNNNRHFFSFFSFCYFFSFSFDTLNQYCYILCLIHQCECIKVLVIIMYISIAMYITITDTLIHSDYCILINSQLVFCHFVFSSKSKIDYGWDRKNSSRNILKFFFSWEVILKGCQWLALMKANKRKFPECFLS